MKIILNGCNTLEKQFAKIDCELVINELKSLQKNTEMISPEMKMIIKKENLPVIITKPSVSMAN